MSKLRSQILEELIIIGNHSGCHQLPERSFFYHGKQFPVCARCTGVVIGQIISLLSMLFCRVLNPILSILFLLIMGIDWFLQWIGILHSTNMRRFITGIIGGYGLFHLYMNIIKLLLKKE